MIPEAEIGDLIVELRSATSGVGSFSARFDHLAELAGKPADAVPWGTKIECEGVMDLITVDDAIGAFERFQSDRRAGRF